MTFCSRCGKRLPQDAEFCPKCGTKAGTSARPSDEMKETLTRMSQEMEKAFLIAAREMQEAFKSARKNIQETIKTETLICSSCGEKNSANAVFCFKCGKNISGPTGQKPKEDT